MADKTGLSSLAITVPDSCFPSYGFNLGTVSYYVVRLLLEECCTRQREPVWQYVRSWGVFFPLLKICTILKAEQVVMREFFYSFITSAGVYKQQEQEDQCWRMNLHSWHYLMYLSDKLVEPFNTMMINSVCSTYILQYCLTVALLL